MNLDQLILHLQERRTELGGNMRVVSPSNCGGYVRDLKTTHKVATAKRDRMRIVSHSGEPALMIDLV